MFMTFFAFSLQALRGLNVSRSSRTTRAYKGPSPSPSFRLLILLGERRQASSRAHPVPSYALRVAEVGSIHMLTLHGLTVVDQPQGNFT